MDKLSGYKTYIAAVLIGIATAAQSLGWIDTKTYELIMAVLGALGLIALRAGVKKSGPQ